MGAFGIELRPVMAARPLTQRRPDAATKTVWLILATAAIRIVLAGALGLGTDESYTVANARAVDWSYVDYPPLHVWLVGFWAQIAGSEAPQILRLPFIAIFAGSTWMMFRLTVLLFGERSGFWAAVLFNLAPVFTLAHASWVLPDGPLAFLMLTGAWFAARSLFREAPASQDMTSWLAAGVCAGLAMLTKYHGAFLLAGIFAYLVTTRSGRLRLMTPAPWLGAVLALVIFAPVVIWNIDHTGAGLFFQSNRLTVAPKFSIARVLSAIVEQSLYVTPWIYVPLAATWGAALAKGPRAPREWFLALIASGPIVFFTLANAIAKGLPHWAMPGWLFVFPLLGMHLARMELTRPALLRNAAIIAALFLLSLVAIFASEAKSGWIASSLPEREAHLDPTLDMLDWNALREAIAARHLADGDTAAVAGLNWIEAGKLNYALGHDIPVLCLCADPQQFRYLHDPRAFAGRDILIIGTAKRFADTAIPSGTFARLEALLHLTLSRGGRPAVTLAVYRGIDFHPRGAADEHGDRLADGRSLVVRR